ncbi:MAG: HAD family hydrolase [uncultured bacterium (gcode 4)]|uniref:HAD family hydrolase n=1 Tax=uncultured bacterium (gcode 4) TaxID=1234023 RepID=K2BBE9_9BACT|nr:MAG: HAD family hydrolase [uncultured bacterium (gcode 4)]
MFKMITFDLDWTLAPSKWQMDNEMAELFKDLLAKYKVWVISGWDYPQFQKQIIPFLWTEEKLLQNLYICPTCSTKMYMFENWEWNKKYSLDFTQEEKNHIIDVLNKAINELNLKPNQIWWELIEDRSTQISYSALWQEAPLEFKKTYDPDFKKRKKIREFILDDLKWFNILLWWASTIDITRIWVDKAYGIKKLVEVSWIWLNEILFVWDAIFEGWNDYPPLEIGVTCKRVFNVEDTKEYIRSLL